MGVRTRCSASNGENDCGIIVLAFIAHENNETESDKLCGHFGSLFPPNDGRKIAEPFQGTNSGEAMFVYLSRLPEKWLCTLCDVGYTDTLSTFVVALECIGGLIRGTYVGGATNKTPEQSCNNGLGYNYLVVG